MLEHAILSTDLALYFKYVDCVQMFVQKQTELSNMEKNNQMFYKTK